MQRAGIMPARCFCGAKTPIMAPSCPAPHQICMFVLRPYQTDAVNAVISHFRKHPDPAG